MTAGTFVRYDEVIGILTEAKNRAGRWAASRRLSSTLAEYDAIVVRDCLEQMIAAVATMEKYDGPLPPQ